VLLLPVCTWSVAKYPESHNKLDSSLPQLGRLDPIRELKSNLLDNSWGFPTATRPGRNYMIDPDVKSDAECLYTFRQLMDWTVPYCMQMDWVLRDSKVGIDYEKRNWFCSQDAIEDFERFGCLN